MTVQIAGHLITSPEQLSEPARAVVGLIVDGEDWLRSAIGDAGHHYHFPSEGALVSGVQNGLHGSELLLVPGLGLQVSAERLFQVPPELLRAVEEAAAAGSYEPTVTTRRLLAQSKLWTADELAGGQIALTQFGLRDDPLFQSLTLGDAIVLFDLFDSTYDSTNHSKAAASFAADRAVTPREFADYYRFYVTVAEASRSEGGADERVATALELLRPVVWPRLRCPHVAYDPSPETVGALVRSWLAEGEPAVGFATASRAVAELAEVAGGTISVAEDAEAAAETFIETSTAVLSSQDPREGELSQDGAVQLFSVEAPDGARVLLVHDRTHGALAVHSLEMAPGMTESSGTTTRKTPKKAAKKAARKTAKKAAKKAKPGMAKKSAGATAKQ